MTYNLIESGQLNRSAAAEALRAFLEETIRVGKFDLKVSVRVLEAGAVPEQGGAEIFADLAGRDNELLLERGAELLQSIEHLAHRALRLEPPFQDKIFLDCAGYRALRVEELKMMARTAAERVQTSRQPFKLNPMNSRERRIVHLALQSVPGIRTESIGFGPTRQVVIHPSDQKPA
ncbi:MAG TPA: R3H domain-containing nucleic acid-binding protein [Candidatus Eisenbacteria bacterium]|jgi:spoIIIJ-associated protein|nr:R3H domain-containing nucleic acid-binding protein [Candidatus Eisenbacteria bacterium]